MSMRYTDPRKQAIVNQAYTNVQRAAHIMTAMQKTLSMTRRVGDAPIELTEKQAAVIVANKGRHIYSPSHPLYKESNNE